MEGCGGMCSETKHPNNSKTIGILDEYGNIQVLDSIFDIIQTLFFFSFCFSDSHYCCFFEDVGHVQPIGIKTTYHIP